MFPLPGNSFGISIGSLYRVLDSHAHQLFQAIFRCFRKTLNSYAVIVIESSKTHGNRAPSYSTK